MMIPILAGTQNVDIEIEYDALLDQLFMRIDELEHEKVKRLSEIDALTADNAELRRQLISMRAA